MWKISHITAIYKHKGLKNDKVNYRPISLLPTLSKMCESIIHHRLLGHCSENNIISYRQAAYIKGDSTVSQLLYLVHKIKLAWTGKKVTHGVFLDVDGAFDKIWHKAMIAKLNSINIEGKLLDLFTSYLSNRQQKTVVDGEKSNTTCIPAGLPQGSRLGPLLFIIYINDITDIGLESEILIFADDCTLMISDPDPQKTVEILNRDLGRISTWASKWKIQFNASKTKSLLFSKKYNENLQPLTFNNENVTKVSSTRHLGLQLSFNLDWKEQVNIMCLKASRKLSVLRRVKNLQRSTLDLLYKTTIISVIDYGLIVYYHSLTQTDKMKIDRIQYSAAKLVSSTMHYTSRVKLEKELGWESMKDRADYLGLTLFHKIH